ncbi:7TM-DISM domain-containing protein [Thalassolituus sp.]|uniref:7TM-DISM domain-containing protein n=1 Tax=Thalassolituus sp. TaxID=2030822 RepID=UPI002A826CB3|nr:7TM-DISM domain-containing protein [Thalassolituus sp.]
MTVQQFRSLTTACMLVLLLLSGLSLSRTAIASGPVLLPGDSFDYPITPYVAIYEDPSARLSLDDMIGQDKQLRFTPSHSNRLKFGITTSAYWFRVSLSNPYNHDRDVVLTLSNTHIDDIRLFDISNPDEPSVLGRGGRDSNGLRGGFPQAQPFFLRISAQTTQSYLIRVHTDALLNTELHLKSVDRFVINEQHQQFIVGISIGIAIAAFIYFLICYRRYRMQLALAAAAYCAVISIFIPSWMGLLHSGFALSGELDGCLESLSINFSAIAHTLVVLFLGWRQRWVRLTLWAFIALQVVIGSGEFWLSSALNEVSISLGIAVNEIFMLFLLIFARSEQKKAQHLLLFGCAFVTVGIVLSVLTSMNVLSLDFIHTWSVIVLPMAVISSLVMACMQLSGRAVPSIARQTSDLTLSSGLLSQISHELRTPINGVIGMNELLTDTALSANQRDYIDTIGLAGRDLLFVANEISDLARIQQGQLELERRPFTISSMLSQTMAHFQQEAIRKQVELVVDIADDLPARLVGDRNRLQTLLHNLIARTLAYTDYGELTLHASYFNSAQSQGVRLQLQLSGNIVKQDELKMLFRLLQYHHPQVEPGNTKHWNLLVMRQLLQRMHASLEVESMTSQGASLTLYLPMPVEAEVVSHRDILDDSLIGMRILIVDDVASLRNVIEKQVKRWGMKASSTYSGKEALAMMRNQCNLGQPFDFIIIDHDMPIMNGLQLAERMNADNDITIKPASLMLTGLSISSVRADALAVGIRHLVAKPASGDRLRNALLEIKSRRHASNQPTDARATS